MAGAISTKRGSTLGTGLLISMIKHREILGPAKTPQTLNSLVFQSCRESLRNLGIFYHFGQGEFRLTKDNRTQLQAITIGMHAALQC